MHLSCTDVLNRVDKVPPTVLTGAAINSERSEACQCWVTFRLTPMIVSDLRDHRDVDDIQSATEAVARCDPCQLAQPQVITENRAP
ncbi:hypothetical protein CA13_29090 [Planctomycetes bacterium CA13]|uniref:Uncharacterized protein n=1 Tax=Novipirellula herctigrandis TaxID=2527986 RepID=A0A5C5Z351_9BACT|nr:hypothetical protein CA13_29090 [Planctomycetes bacterium CA13]